jgi:hypothetical protein
MSAGGPNSERALVLPATGAQTGADHTQQDRCMKWSLQKIYITQMSCSRCALGFRAGVSSCRVRSTIGRSDHGG